MSGGSVLSRWLGKSAEKVDHTFGWDHLPLPLAIPTLVGLRDRLRELNLYDTGRGPKDVPQFDDHAGYMGARTLDGTYNDLSDPLMGSLGSRFGRNVPIADTWPEK